MDHKPVIVEHIFDSTVEIVWKAVSDKSEMKKWYFDLETFRAEVGFRFQFVGGPDDGIQYLHLCEITEVILFKKLSYSWRYDGYSGNSLVTFELFAQGHQTILRLTHSGLETFPVENTDFARRNFEEGWNSIIHTSLKAYLNKEV